MDHEDEAPLDWDPDETTAVILRHARAVRPHPTALTPPTVSAPASAGPMAFVNSTAFEPPGRSGLPPAWLGIVAALTLGLGAGYFVFGRPGDGGATSVAEAQLRNAALVGEEAPALSVRSRGALAAEAVERSVSASAGSLVQRCWLTARATREADADTTAEVVVNVDIRDTGGVRSVEVVGNAKGYRSLGSCVRDEALRWMFPVAAGDTVVRVAVRFGPRAAR